VTAASAPIPARLNLVLLGAGASVCCALLYAASHAEGWAAPLLAALAFSFAANTMFSLLHESVHGILHPDARVNRWGGRFAAAFFPTSLTLQRGFHLTHHRNNRGPLERFDYIERGDIVWLKRAQWYSILTGFYWVVTQLGLLIYLVAPVVFTLPVLRDAGSQSAQQTSARAYLAAFDKADARVARLEILGSLAFQVVLFLVLDVNVAGWALCYAAFAVHWSALQYADHAFSPLDAQEGAWNLRVNPISRALFLNYHYHRAHHRHPQTPWLHLPRLVDPAERQPSFLGVWLSMWRGPRRIDGPQ
jgi:fatty acid desaturase